MKVTKSQLKNIIMEEINKCLNEWDYYSSDGNYQEFEPRYSSHLSYEHILNDYLEEEFPDKDHSETYDEYRDMTEELEQKNPQLYDEFANLIFNKKIEVDLYDFNGENCSDIDIYIDPEFKQFLETKLKQQEPELYQLLATQIFDEDTITDVYCKYAEAVEDGRYQDDEPEYDRDFNWDN